MRRQMMWVCRCRIQCLSLSQCQNPIQNRRYRPSSRRWSHLQIHFQSQSQSQTQTQTQTQTQKSQQAGNYHCRYQGQPNRLGQASERAGCETEASRGQ